MVDLKLVNYIKRHLQKGYSKKELVDILKKNKWDKKEIDSAFNFISSKKDAKPASKPASTKPTKQEHLAVLKGFISRSRAKGISDEEIKNALIAKKWPNDLIQRGFGSAGVEKVTRPPEEKPKKEKVPFRLSQLVWYFIAFIVAGIIISGTIFVYYYVVGLSQFTITIDGEEQYGKCFEVDCSDMKESAFDYAKDNIQFMLIVGAIASLVIVLLYALLPIKNIILWIVNILYFLFLVYIGVRWIMFTRSI